MPDRCRCRGISCSGSVELNTVSRLIESGSTLLFECEADTEELKGQCRAEDQNPWPGLTLPHEAPEPSEWGWALCPGLGQALANTWSGKMTTPLCMFHTFQETAALPLLVFLFWPPCLPPFCPPPWPFQTWWLVQFLKGTWFLPVFLLLPLEVGCEEGSLPSLSVSWKLLLWPHGSFWWVARLVMTLNSNFGILWIEKTELPLPVEMCVGEQLVWLTRQRGRGGLHWY